MFRIAEKLRLWGFVGIIVATGIWLLASGTLATLASNVSAGESLSPSPFSSPIGNPVLAVQKTANQDTVLPGEAIAYTLTYSSTNPGSQAFNVRLYDFLPAGVEFLYAIPAPSYNADGVLVFTAPSVSPANSQVTIYAQVRTGYEELLNHALIVAEGVAPAHATLATQVALGTPQLTITKTGYLAVLPGHTMVYQLRCRNIGDVIVENITLADVLPTGVTLVSSSPAPSSATVPLLEWEIDSLAAGEMWQATVTVLAPATPGVITNTLLASGEGVAMTGKLFATQVVSEAAILWLEKTASHATISQGVPLVYRLSYANIGNRPASGVVLTDTIPAGLTIIGTAPAPAMLTANYGVWQLGSLAAGASGQVVITATVEGDEARLLVNTADITAPLAYPFHAQVEVYFDPLLKLYLPLVMRNHH